VKSFAKVLAGISPELVTELWDKPAYASREAFLNEVEGIQGTPQMRKEELVRVLDEALRNVRVSPSVVFTEADSDRDGVVQVQEMDKILKRLGIQIESVTLEKIIKEIDINGNGLIEQQEFYNLFR